MVLALAAVQGLKNHKMQMLVESLSLAEQTVTHYCSDAINKWKNTNQTFNYQAVITAGKAWNDTTFPATSDALWWKVVKQPTTYKSRLSTVKVQWGRASQKIPGASIFKSVDVNDIKQMSLGDCYFLSSCSAVGEFESRLKAAFVTQTMNTAGIVVLQGYVLGLKRKIYIDDFLPFDGRYTVAPYKTW